MSFFRKHDAERELDSELRFHIDRQTASHIAAGLSPMQARRRALLEFGGLQQTKESVRDVKWITHLESVFRDFSFAVRSLVKDRRLSCTAILTLALGIGATTVIFSVFYNILLKPFPYKNFDRVVILNMRGINNVGGWKGRNFFSIAEFQGFQSQNHVLENLCGAESYSLLFEDGRSTRVFQGAKVTPNFFDFYGVSPLIGHAPASIDATPEASSIFVMNYRLWRKEFSGDPEIVGRTYSIDGKSRTLIAIMPPQFDANGRDVWIPVSLNSPEAPMFSILARAKPGISAIAIAADLDAIAHRTQPSTPAEGYPDKFQIEAVPFRDAALGNFKETLLALLGAVFLLLLIACSNVSNLLLARATVRGAEMATRQALGASRFRLIRQLFVENTVLAGTACLIGCIFALIGCEAIRILIPANFVPGETTININRPVLLIAVGVAIFSALLCGLAPAFHAAKVDLRLRLSGDAKGMQGNFRYETLRSSLVVLEIALSFVLLVSSVSLFRNFLALTRTDFGFEPRNIFYLRPYFPRPQYLAKEKQNAFTKELLQRMAALPGVNSTAESMLIPPLYWDWSDTIIPGKPHEERWLSKYTICSEGFFRTFNLQPLRGRTFTESDVEAQRLVAVVNDVFARTYFPYEDPVGKRVKLQVLDRSFLDAPHNAYFEILGVVTGIKSRDENNLSWESPPQIFIPYSIQGFSHRILFARTSIDARIVLNEAQRQLHDMDPGVGNWSSGTVEDVLGDFYRQPRFELFVLATFGGLAILLAMAGIFSVMAYFVSLHTHEIGIRMALGAPQMKILRGVLKQGTKLTAIGLLMGFCFSLAAMRLLQNQIDGSSSNDPRIFIIVAILLATSALLACYLPACRAIRVDPVIALRYE